ncbi:MAG TPA: exodeoxyribonuclease VII small subunit [Bacillota bacterium]|nr:exodeoxyribonuclease VII small subunit [Bacillota bacterium]HOH10743.1 exodeoxyribonuclease VII small subunit [Bacillota bacterium]HOS50303.1 exodeoxyribonuclease VII small subunit [Bacillota bacterium]HQJ25512.1 exodeoxyribonuclease VII small subunit [Bacillota bacterium]
MARKKVSAESFETMMTRLSEIAGLMESRDIDIERAMALYEEGYELIGKLRAVLDAAEEKVKLLGPDGKLVDMEAGEGGR